LEQVASFPANWTRVLLSRDPSGWYPSRLLLRCHGQRMEIAARVVEAEREELAAALAGCLGFACLRDGASSAGAFVSATLSQAHALQRDRDAWTFLDDGARSGTDAERSAGSKFEQ
jgi:hypothetical protein